GIRDFHVTGVQTCALSILQLAKKAGTTPRALAEVLAGRLRAVPGVAQVEVAGPGFLNMTVTAGAAGALARTVVEAGPRYGHGDEIGRASWRERGESRRVAV